MRTYVSTFRGVSAEQQRLARCAIAWMRWRAANDPEYRKHPRRCR